MRRVAVLALVGACGGNTATVPDSPSQVDARPDATERMYGFVAVLENAPQNSTAVLGLIGTIRDVTVSSRDDGPCHIEQTSPGADTSLDAGTMTVAGGTAATVTIMFDMTNNYFATTQGLTYSANDSIAISTTGAVAPALSGTVMFPASLTVTSPALTTLPKSGFTTTWTATTSPVLVIVNQYPSGGPSLNITCSFAGAAGTGMVPASALTELATNVTAGVGVSTRTDVMTAAGGYAIDLYGIYGARTTNNLTVQP